MIYDTSLHVFSRIIYSVLIVCLCFVSSYCSLYMWLLYAISLTLLVDFGVFSFVHYIVCYVLRLFGLGRVLSRTRKQQLCSCYVCALLMYLGDHACCQFIIMFRRCICYICGLTSVYYFVYVFVPVGRESARAVGGSQTHRDFQGPPVRGPFIVINLSLCIYIYI